jgi:putative ABC transport system permease protein
MNVMKIAWRNLLRHKRRSLLTAALISLGVILVIVFGGVGNTFKNEVISVLTSSALGDIQIHKRGYVGSIDNLPLDMNIPEQALARIEASLKNDPDVAAYTRRIRFGAMISNFTQTSNMRFTAIYPDEENRTCSSLVKRIKEGDSDPATFVRPGFIIVPENIAAGMKLTVGSDVVLVATNKDGSVNGLNLRVSGISENILGPQGKDGNIHMDDAKKLLRIENGEVTEIAIKLKDFNTLEETRSRLAGGLGGSPQTKGANAKSDKNGDKAGLEFHTWEELSPFASIAQIIGLLLLLIRVVLGFIVVVSILNVMLMSVYERIGEIGTIASIGTLPSRILQLFLAEGLVLGFLSALVGSVIGIGILLVMGALKPNITFGRMNLALVPQVPLLEVLLAIVVVVVISAIASLQPALKASRMEPVDALRHV